MSRVGAAPVPKPSNKKLAIMASKPTGAKRKTCTPRLKEPDKMTSSAADGTTNSRHLPGNRFNF